MTPPPANGSLRRALEHLVEHASDPAVLLIAADALDEAAREAALLGHADTDLRDLAGIARHRATTLRREAP